MLRVLHVHAHFDDFEFVAAGTFELWRRRLSGGFRGRVLVCTDGRSGHHARSREETARIRADEQAASAHVGAYEWELLRKPDGSPFAEACRTLTTDLMASLWKAIRDFEPHYILCPPLPLDGLAGIHPDHVTVAEAVRRVAYMINVPHAFLDEYPAPEDEPARWIQTPVILNVYDSYMTGANAGDLVVDVEEVLDVIAGESWCHQSQIREWLPWVGRHQMDPVGNLESWKEVLRRRFRRQAIELGLNPARAHEVFTVTAWGTVPSFEQLQTDFPNLVPDAVRERRLVQQLQRWNPA